MHLNGVRLAAGTQVICVELKDKYYSVYYDVGDVCIVNDGGTLRSTRTGYTSLGGDYADWEIYMLEPLQYEEMM